MIKSLAGKNFKSWAETDDAALAGFDRNDRKFVAVALASGEHPTILNATDSDWRIFGSAPTKHGVQTQFLCLELMEE